MFRTRGSTADAANREHDLTPQNPVSGNRMQGKAPLTAELLILETISAKRYRYTRRSRQSCPSSLDARRWPGVVRKSVKILYQKRLSRPIFLPLCNMH